MSRRWLSLLLASAVLAGCSSRSSPPPPTSSAVTLHYHRPLSDLGGWAAVVSVGAVEASATSTQRDGFGAVYALTLKPGATTLAFTLANGSTSDPAGALSVDVSGTIREAWVFSGFAEAVTHQPVAIPGTDQVAVYYVRPDSNYAGWGLHTWGDVAKETVWQGPLPPVGVDPEFGAGFLINMKPAGDRVNIIVHQGDTKDPGPDMGWSRAALGDIVFVYSGSALITAAPRKAGAVEIAGASAHLAARDTVAWDVTDPAASTFELRYSSTAEVVAQGTDVTGGTVIALTPRPAGLDPALLALAPYLRTAAGDPWRAFDVAAADLPGLRDALKGQMVAVARKVDGSVLKATHVQTALALDDLYAYSGPLGVTFTAQAPTFGLWAPTAQAVRLHVADAANAELAAVDMTVDGQGVWSATGPAGWYGQYYRYEITVYHPATEKIEHVLVTDPYAVNLDTNGLWAQIVDLGNPALKPAGWDALVKPPLGAPEDIVLYESHIRDFSALDPTVPAARRGKYLAFTTDSAATPSQGLQHLGALAAAGLTHVHLLPAFDIATVNEDPSQRVDVDQAFSTLCAKNTAVPASLCTQFSGNTILEALQSFVGDSDQQQAIAGYMAGLDSFNWGYDPFHYGAPEGSYASTAEGTAKIVEFRAMVKGLADLGLRVVMDVVYNHTNAAGLADKSVLDKVVPGYYHRLDPLTGFVLNSSCCSNTASEHVMMERLMVDTLVRWARDYKVDGFRFDLMGLHLRSNLLRVRDALAALTPAADGVDGSKIYLYGEGWDVGEMVRNARGTNATQLNMAGTGVGTFNDRLRDGARGGGPFDSGNQLRRNQGFSSGLFTDPNELGSAQPADRDALAHALDLIKIGMAGSLADFALVTATGSTTVSSAVGYGGAGAGYTLDPSESVNYVSSHDNQILWDIVQYKMPTGRNMNDRVRAAALAMDVVLLGQGVPFFHMGDDLLRSKSMERDSYDSGDWFNRIDWSGQTNGWRSGLPNAGKDSGNWPVILPILADATITPAVGDISLASAHFQAMLKVRKSSRLFRLTTRDDVMKRVDFLNTGPTQVPGVIAMTISDGTCGGADLDPTREAVVVIVNADKASHEVVVPGATAGFRLHPLLAGDPLAAGTSVAVDHFTVPARTTAVFELPQTAAQGAGLPCNTHL